MPTISQALLSKNQIMTLITQPQKNIQEEEEEEEEEKKKKKRQ